jgi:hypothetical protein
MRRLASQRVKGGAFKATSEFVKPRRKLSAGIWGKRVDMNRHPTASGSSHLLEGVLLGLLGVSLTNQNQKLNKLPVFFA